MLVEFCLAASSCILLHITSIQFACEKGQQTYLCPPSSDPTISGLNRYTHASEQFHRLLGMHRLSLFIPRIEEGKRIECFTLNSEALPRVESSDSEFFGRRFHTSSDPCDSGPRHDRSGPNPPYEASCGWWVFLPSPLGSSLSILAHRIARGCDRWCGELRRPAGVFEGLDKRVGTHSPQPAMFSHL